MSGEARELRALEDVVLNGFEPRVAGVEASLRRELGARWSREDLRDDVRRARVVGSSSIRALREPLEASIAAARSQGVGLALAHLDAAAIDATESLRTPVSEIIARCERAVRSLRPVPGEPPSTYASRAAAHVAAVVRGEAQRAIRTALYRGYNETAAATLRANGLARRWDATLDARLCERCNAFDGKVCEPGEVFRDEYDNPVEPPLHPNCRCRLEPVATSSRLEVPTGDDEDRISLDEAEVAMQEFLDDTGLGDYLQRMGVTATPVTDIVPEGGDELPPGRVIKGDFGGNWTIRVATTPVRPSGTFERGDQGIVRGAATEREAVQRAMAHEVGEVVHRHLIILCNDEGAPNRRECIQILNSVSALLGRSVRNGDPLSEYGTTNRGECLSELIAGYLYERGRLTVEERRLAENALRAAGAIP